MENTSIGVLTFPISEAGNTPLTDLINILKCDFKNIYLVTGNNGYTKFIKDETINTFGVSHKSHNFFLVRICDYFLTQLKLSKILLSLKNVDNWIFFIGGDTLILPMMTLKILRKKVYLVFPGSSIKTLASANDMLVFPLIILSKINCILSYRIVLYSDIHIAEYGLNDFKNKILTGSQHYLDFNRFRIEKSLIKRDNLIGYIGRLSDEKGVMNFIESIPLISAKRSDLKFFIAGDGGLRDKVLNYIHINNFSEKIEIMDWIPHNELPQYMNKLKLIVLPSFTEGLPNIILEAMACGTPVLATPVGAIPDLIIDSQTGFISSNNSPELLSYNILRAIDCPDIEKIALNANRFVQEHYTYENAVKKWKEILVNGK